MSAEEKVVNALLDNSSPVLGVWIGNQIRIRRIRMFLGLPDPDPLVRGTEPNPALDPSLFS
jgi:hypothetical protein